MSFNFNVDQDLAKPCGRALLPCDGFTHVRNIDAAGEVIEVTFRAAQHGAMLQAASELLNDRYAWRGYGSSHSIPAGVHHTTFTAEVDGDVVGTTTLAIDSDRGLAIDDTFSDEVEQIRNADDTRICELTRLAFHSSVRSKEVLANLFHFTFIVGTTISRCTDLLIEVGPRHTLFYEAMLGFEAVGPLKTNTSVGSQSQLMRLKVEAIRSNINKLAGKTAGRSARSLYTYFLSQAEEKAIRRAYKVDQNRNVASLRPPGERTRFLLERKCASPSTKVSALRFRPHLGSDEFNRTYEAHLAA